jgi:glycosyltransferase involved in cell wall biosynthesis
MKLAIHNGSRLWGGNEKWVAMLAAGLADRGHQVAVACPPGPLRRALEEMGVATTDARPRGDAALLAAARFAWWLRGERPDALLLTSWRTTPWAAWAARVAGVPRVVARLGIARPVPPRGRIARTFRRRIDAVIVNAPEVRDTFAASAQWFPGDAIHVILNGVRPPAVGHGTLRERLRRELRAEIGDVLVGGAGNLSARKGFDVLLRAFSAADLAAARLVVVGGGEAMGDLRALAERLGITSRVHFLGARADAAEVIGGLDLFVLPSRNEGMANVMLEAMAGGVPVIATDVSGARAALAAGDGGDPAGWIVPMDDEAALSAALCDVAGGVVEGSDEVTARTAEASRRVRERFGVERMVMECERVLFGPCT